MKNGRGMKTRPKEYGVSPGIGELNEYSIHSELKSRYGGEDATYEGVVDGYVVDVVREGLLIEIQTSNFSQIRGKLTGLLKGHRVTLVYPLAVEKHILVYDEHMQNLLYRRRSPKRGTPYHIFEEVIYILPLLLEPDFTLEVLFTREEEIRCKDGLGSWRRKGVSIHDRRLLEIVGTRIFSGREDYRALLPESLPDFFTNRNLSNIIGLPRAKAGKITYCMTRLGILRVKGKKGNANVFAVV
ncbi:MAG: hypothetical protein JXQ30_16100 [Spirochaetes bacterium]|nr:hypothetical protein [Spirochaetota bacterium]